jgi:hypothetical protein
VECFIPRSSLHQVYLRVCPPDDPLPRTRETAGSPFIVGATYALTNYIYFQQPYITKTVCPDCGTRMREYIL